MLGTRRLTRPILPYDGIDVCCLDGVDDKVAAAGHQVPVPEHIEAAVLELLAEGGVLFRAVAYIDAAGVGGRGRAGRVGE